MNIPNCWAVLKDVIETVQMQEDQQAEYLYMKEPSQIQYRLIKMVNDENEEDDESDSDDDGL